MSLLTVLILTVSFVPLCGSDKTIRAPTQFLGYEYFLSNSIPVRSYYDQQQLCKERGMDIVAYNFHRATAKTMGEYNWLRKQIMDLFKGVQVEYPLVYLGWKVNDGNNYDNSRYMKSPWSYVSAVWSTVPPGRGLWLPGSPKYRAGWKTGCLVLNGKKRNPESDSYKIDNWWCHEDHFKNLAKFKSYKFALVCVKKTPVIM